MAGTQDDEEVPRHRSRKDTRRWCRGKEGVPHDPVWGHDPRFTWGTSDPWLVYACRRCGKRMGLWAGWENERRRRRGLPELPAPVLGSTAPPPRG